MAERRMFAKTIVTSDAFLDMPASTRCLYFLLGMVADDDGFVNNPKSIMRQAGCTADDLNLLIAKRFLLTFQSGVVVIKHWCIHNTIQKDRYKETKYLEEKSQLMLDGNKAYTEAASDVYPECIQDVSKPEPQVRLGEVNIGKSNIRDDIEADEADDENQKSTVSCQAIVDLYHSICISYPKIRSISNARRTAIKARLNTYSLDEFRAVFENAEASSFLKGKNERNWSATFDWLLTDRNMAKVLEGNYADRGSARKEKGQQLSGHRELDDDEMAAIRQMLSDDSSEPWEV